MKNLVRAVIGIAAMLALTPASARATTIIDFGTGSGGDGGLVTIGANITGTDIFIDSVIISGALQNNGTFDVDGAGVCADATGGCGLLNFDRNANTISIVGTIPQLGILAPVTLLSGNLSCGVSVQNSNDSVVSLTACGTDTKSTALLLAIGLPTNTSFALFGFETAANINATGSPYTAFSTDITNRSVPDGGTTVGLLGLGMLGVGYLRRRMA